MIEIRLADPAAPELREMLEAHMRHAAAHCPEDVNYALDAQALRDSGVEFWAAFHEERAVGCGGLLALGDGTAEVKTVHIVEDMRGRGLARQIMVHLAEEAQYGGSARQQEDQPDADADEAEHRP